MNQENRLTYLLNYVTQDYTGKSNLEIPAAYAEKRALFRAFVNIRPPRPVTAEFLQMQDAFLQEEAAQKGFVKPEDLLPCPSNHRLSLWHGDITRLAADAIVNAANSQLLGCFVPQHHCIDNAIHTAAGIQLRAKCHEIMQAQGHPEQTGKAKITAAFNLPAQYIMHTVGPIVQGTPTKSQEEELAQCYKSCLEAATQKAIHSIAFCCISTGIFAFPKSLAAKIAVHTVLEYLPAHKPIEQVIFNVFTPEDYSIYKKILS